MGRNRAIRIKKKLWELPKTDLHCHLDGSLRLATLIELARVHKVKLPTTRPDKLAELLHLGDPCGSLENYLKGFKTTVAVMQWAEALSRIAYELAEDCARENIWYLEVRFCPILHTQKGLSLPQVVDAVRTGLREAERRYNIKTGLIICGLRNIGPLTSFELAELTCAYKNQGVMGFDLAGAEWNFPAKDHMQAFDLVLKSNINCTVHAGEGFGPASIAQALHYCGAHRIGHGTRLREDGDLLNYVADHRIPLEICLSSNVQTGVCESIAKHPARFYYDYGIRVTFNTDNRLITKTTMTDELYLAHTELGLEIEDIITILLNGFKSSFLAYHERVSLLKRARETMLGRKATILRSLQASEI